MMNSTYKCDQENDNVCPLSGLVFLVLVSHQISVLLNLHIPSSGNAPVIPKHLSLFTDNC